MSHTASTSRLAAAAALSFVLFVTPSALGAREPRVEGTWPAWRGPDGQGIVDGEDVPLEWTLTRNVLWKAAVPGRGLSSPVVWGDRMFLTTALEGEVVPGAKAIPHKLGDEPFVHPQAMGADRRHTFKVLSLDARDGSTVWERTAWEGIPVDSRHKKASFASPTTVTDGERVYAYFGSEGLYAYDYSGDLLWSFDPGVIGTIAIGRGPASRGTERQLE